MKAARIREINDALALLDKAAQEEAQRLGDLIGRDYRSLRRLLLRLRPKVRSAFQDMGEYSGEKFSDFTRQAKTIGQRTLRKCDREVHRHPWAYAGWAALAGA